jgi:hypothetical protein
LAGSSESANSRLERVGTDATANLGWCLGYERFFFFQAWSVYHVVLNSIGKGSLHLTEEFVLTRIQIDLFRVVLLLSSCSDTGAKPLNFSSASESSDFLVWIVDFGPFLREISVKRGERSVQILLVALLLSNSETSSHSTNHGTQSSFHARALRCITSTNSVRERTRSTHIIVACSLLELSHLATE